MSMKDKEIEKLAFALNIGQLVVYTTEKIIEEDNLIGSEGEYMFGNRKFKIVVSEATDGKAD